MEANPNLTPVHWLWLIPVLPLVGAAINGILGARLQAKFGKGVVSAVAVSMMAASALVALVHFAMLLRLPAEGRYLLDQVFPMIRLGAFQVDFAFAMDPLGGLMACVVTVIGTAIHVYATGYMHDEPSYWRFFCYLNLFCFAMLLLVLGDSFVLMFFGWEGVGLCSYLLIGFWYTDVEKAKAGMKAFVVNRVGDWGFLCGLMVLFWGLAGIWGATGTEATLVFRDLRDQLAKPEVREALSTPVLLGGSVAFWACLGFFVGATGKSAQIPLYVWLPDAMAGPTPVSALIHAATMVTAGVYMIARLNFLFAISPGASTIVACVGAATALFAATIGFFQHDIKKVLAYSTVSQLGYMFVGVGVGAYWAGVYHLFTHAFFKACLFLGSGSVIHAMHWVHHRHGHGHGHGHGAHPPDLRLAPDPADPQDMRNMGGLAKLMPVTRWTYLYACIAIAGFPIASGFFSKDAILHAAFSAHHLLVPGWLLFAVGLAGAGCTAFYMFRSYFMTFHYRAPTPDHEHHVHESPAAMSYVLVFLAVGAGLALLLGVPLGANGHTALETFLQPVTAIATGLLPAHAFSWGSFALFGLISIAVAGVGVLVAYRLYHDGAATEALRERWRQRWDRAHRTVFDKYYVDEAYARTVVGSTMDLSRDFARFDLGAIDWLVNAAGAVTRAVGRIGGWIDFYLVDGLVNAVADQTVRAGRKARTLQTGRINNYTLAIVGGAVAVVIVTFFVGK